MLLGGITSEEAKIPSEHAQRDSSIQGDQEADKTKEVLQERTENQVKYIRLGIPADKNPSTSKGLNKEIILKVVATKKIATTDACIQVDFADEVGKVICERAIDSNKTCFHTLKTIPTWKTCTECFKELRKVLSYKLADKRAKRAITFCVECNKVICSYCFKITHPVAKTT